MKHTVIAVLLFFAIIAGVTFNSRAVTSMIGGFLEKLEALPTDENGIDFAAFKKLINQGMILGISYKDKRGVLVPTDQVEFTPAGPVRKSDGEALVEFDSKIAKIGGK